MKTNITTLKDEQCQQCFADIPKGSNAVYEEHLFCSDECRDEWLSEWEPEYKEHYGDGSKF